MMNRTTTGTLFALALLGMTACEAFAGPFPKIPLPGLPGIPSGGSGYHQVHIKNDTGETIYVAASHQVRTSSGTAWKQDGYWKLSPGETAYVLETLNSYIYLHAHSESGKTWGDQNRQYRIRGQLKPFFEVNMGKNVKFTQRFTN